LFRPCEVSLVLLRSKRFASHPGISQQPDVSWASSKVEIMTGAGAAQTRRQLLLTMVGITAGPIARPLLPRREDSPMNTHSNATERQL